MQELIAPIVNLGILIAVLVVYTRKPLGAFVASRHATLRDQILNVRKQLTGAQEKYEEFSAKLKTIDSEIAVLREQARQDAQGAKNRAGSEVQRLSAGVVADARTASSQLFDDLKTQLRHDLAVRALERAEAILNVRLTGDDKARLRREFSTQVEGAQS
jgi:F0F1-type ATP synthase membrane subunit b/b'